MKAKIIPIDAPFLPTFSEWLSHKFARLLPDLSRILIVFPSQRNKYYFRRALLGASGKEGLLLPTLLTMEEFMGLLFERLGGEGGRVLDWIERNALLKGVIESIRISQFQGIPFLKFISLGDRLFRFFDELVREKTSIDQIIGKKETLHFPERYIKEELPILKRIFDEYTNRLQEEGYMDLPSRGLWIERQLPKKPDVLKDFSHLFVAGFVAPTKLEVFIVKEASASLPSELILHSNEAALADDATRLPENPFYQHQKLLQRFEVKPDEVETLTSQEPFSPAIRIKRTEAELEEVIYISSLVKNLRRYQPHHIAVILPDESMRVAVVEALRALGIRYNLTMGINFTHCPLYSFLWLLGEVVEENFRYREFLAFLKHPLVKSAVTDGKEFRPVVYMIERRMKRENLIQFDPGRVDKEAKEPLLELVSHWTRVIKEDRPLPEYASGLYRLVEEVLELNQSFVEGSHPGTSQFLDRLSEIQRLRLPRGTVGKGKRKLDFILRVLAEDAFTFEGDPFCGIQVMGVLEARNLDLDCVILPQLNEGIFPRKSEKELFLPFGLRKEIGLPYDKERESLYHYYFTELIHGKKEVYLSYVEREDRDVKSRWIDLLVDEGHQIDESPVPLLKKEPKQIETKLIKKEQGIIKKIRSLYLSPSALRGYKVCSYRFYLKYVLEVAEPEVIEEEPSPARWGSIIHAALSDFYEKDYPQGFKVEESSLAEERLFRRLQEKFKESFASPKPASIFDLDIHGDRLKSLIDADCERFKRGFTIHRLEKPLEYDLLLPTGGRVRLSGRPDRVDEREGKFYIIDYKTGNKPPSRDYKIGKDFKEFQLPFYALALCEDADFSLIGGLIYYYYDRKEGKFRLEDIVEDEIEYLRDFKQSVLVPTISEIINPDKIFVQTEDLDQCRICAYSDYCGRE